MKESITTKSSYPRSSSIEATLESRELFSTSIKVLNSRGGVKQEHYIQGPQYLTLEKLEEKKMI